MILRTDAPYGCIISFIRHMKLTRRLPFLAIYSKYGSVMKERERGTFFQLKAYERGTFSVKMVYNRFDRGA